MIAMATTRMAMMGRVVPRLAPRYSALRSEGDWGGMRGPVVGMMGLAMVEEGLSMAALK